MSKVLYIEDNFENRLLVRRILMASDFEVIEAENARDGISKAQSDPPDIILMDISMPDMDGLTATGKLREIDKLDGVPIIAVTANVMPGDKQMILDAGCDGYISKPIDIDRFVDQVSDFIRSRRT